MIRETLCVMRVACCVKPIRDQDAAAAHGCFSPALMSARETPSVARATLSSADSGPLKWMVRWTCERLLPGANAAAGEEDSSSKKGPMGLAPGVGGPSL